MRSDASIQAHSLRYRFEAPLVLAVFSAILGQRDDVLISVQVNAESRIKIKYYPSLQYIEYFRKRFMARRLNNQLPQK